jgi:hypothetical protein
MSVVGLRTFFFVWKMSNKCLTNVQKFPLFLRLFFKILLAGIYETKIMTKCVQFVHIFADLFILKCLTKIFNFGSKMFDRLLTAWKNTLFLPNFDKGLATLFIKSSKFEFFVQISLPHTKAVQKSWKTVWKLSGKTVCVCWFIIKGPIFKSETLTHIIILRSDFDQQK